MHRLQTTVTGATQRACECQLPGRRVVDQLRLASFSHDPARQLAASLRPAGCTPSRSLRASSRHRVGVCSAVGRDVEVGLADSKVENAVEPANSLSNGSASRAASDDVSSAAESDPDGTVCMFSGNVIDDPEKQAQKQQVSSGMGNTIEQA